MYDKIKELVSSSIALGEVKARIALFPELHNVNKKYVSTYMKSEGYSDSDLLRWERNGIITVKRGGARVPAKYDLQQIMEVILREKVRQIIR